MEMPGNRECEVRERSRVQMVEVLANNGGGAAPRVQAIFRSMEVSEQDVSDNTQQCGIKCLC